MVGEVVRINIEVLTEENAKYEWDNSIKKLPWHNLYQSYRWGEIKREYGWIPTRTVVKDVNGKIVSAAQALIKKRFGCMVGWVPGGPLFFDIKSITPAVNHFYNRNGLLKYLRIYPMSPESEENAEWLVNEGWTHPKNPFHKSMTIILNIDDDIDLIKKQLRQKWRYYLNCSYSFSHTFRIVNDEKDFSPLINAHIDMCRNRGLKNSLELTELELMKEKLKEDLIIFATYENESFTSGWIIARFMDTAYVLRAVTTERGRDTLASYFCLWEAIKHLKDKGCNKVEMGGIDPEDNRGVTHFKRGLGGKEIKWLGEWEVGNNKVITNVVNWLI